MEAKNILLQQLEGQIKVICFRFFICGILLFAQLGCNATENKKFNSFIEIFELTELPIDFSSLERGKRVSVDEFDMFLDLDSTKWKKDDEFSYFSIARFKLKKFVGLIFERVYESEYQDYKIEQVLCIFDKLGNLKSTVIVGGNYLVGDYETYIDCEFKSDLTLKIKREKYFKGENEKTKISFYEIKSDSGEIIKTR